MKAIILAAGVNSRLKDYIDIPKCLLPFKKSTILENQISSLMNAGLKREDIIIVVGYKQEMIKKVHEYILFNPNVEFGNGYGLYLPLQYLLYEKGLDEDEEILVLDGDLVYDVNLICRINASKKGNVLVNRPIEYSNALKDEISIINENRKILKLIIPSKENPLNKEYSNKPLYSYVGIMKISKNIAIKLNEKLKNFRQGWYTIPLTDLIPVSDFYSFEVPKNLKHCFDVDIKEDLDKLSSINNAAKNNE